MADYDSIIIGSGAGGLTTALCLARAGQKVLVIEQHYVPGGWCHSFYIDGHRFSPGVHYMGLMDEGQSTSNLYKGLGIANDLVFFRMNPDAYEHCHIGNEKIDIPANPDKLYESLAARFPHEKKRLKKYISLIQKVSNEIYLIPKMKGFWDHLTIAFRTKNMGKYGLFSLQRVIDWHIKDRMLQNVLNIQCGDHGLPPSQVKFPLHCALMGHYMEGGFYPMGGGAAIVKAMTKSIKKNGGVIKTGVGVKRILTEQSAGKKYISTGVELENGELITATRIISNTDPTATYKLVDNEILSPGLKARLEKTRYSLTSLMFFLIVDMDVKKAGMDSGNIWLMPDADLDNIYNSAKHEDILAGDTFPALFISCSSLKDPTSYDGKHHCIEVITYIDYDAFKAKLPQGDGFETAYRELKEQLCDKLLRSLNNVVPGISNHVVHLELGTPFTNEHYIRSTKGNVYGTEKNFKQIGPFAFRTKTEIDNLFLCGASILSHGVAGASYSGVKTAATILNCTDDELIQPDPSQELLILEAEDSSSWPEWLHQKIAAKKKKAAVKPGLKPA